MLLTTDSAFKIQLKAMLIDSSLNSVVTVLANLHQSFLEAAVRCLEYARVLSRVRTTCSSLLISTSKISQFCAKESKARMHVVLHSKLLCAILDDGHAAWTINTMCTAGCTTDQVR
jgi:hypothetical protein